MKRRSFLLSAGAIGAATAAGMWRWQEIYPQINAPGRIAGHYLRDHSRLPVPTEFIETEVAILGSGIAGLTAGWKLRKEGLQNVLMVSGPELYGNAASGNFGDLAYPTGAHYLPVPSVESFHVREILSDLGIILKNPNSERPYYDERFLLHAPEERLLFNGRWQENLIPTEGVPQIELDEHRRYFNEIERLRQIRDASGKRIFALPSTFSSREPAWQELDKISFKAWLEKNGYISPTLHWYLNYCCRDDFGARYEHVSAWAGLHYFCSRAGKAENAESGAWLTWPGGLGPIAEKLATGVLRKDGTVYKLVNTASGVDVYCFVLDQGVPKTYIVRAKTAICAMPLMVASHVIPFIRDFGFDPQLHMPTYAPWLVANFLMNDFPVELPDAPLAWDNVVYQEPGLGFVVSTHQDIRRTPPAKTVFSSYVALSNLTPEAARRWMDKATPDELLDLAMADLKAAYGWEFSTYVERVDITLRAHAMPIPAPQFRSNVGLQSLRELTGSILFAHSDLSGFSVFEEASWWGYRAAQTILKKG
ncbi:NAD(P)-binding protein [Undibacterium sp. SXout20W]|uniref:NAD(P)-binding protein n=1 Tax=Undibacterium sp. SXout20W TaxID=3413051 RepID=UPI003BF0B869